MFVRANFVDFYSQGMRDRSMRSGTELAGEIKLTDWSMAGNLQQLRKILHTHSFIHALFDEATDMDLPYKK